MTDSDIIKWFCLGVAVGGMIVHVFWLVFFKDHIEGLNNGR